MKNVLISGASIAGLSTAYWLTQLGYAVTIVETASSVRTGGTAVDIKGDTVEIVRRMGLLDAIKANRLRLERTQFVNAEDVAVREMVVTPSDDELEIERDVLLGLLLDAVRANVELVFSDSITALSETAAGIEVTFQRGAPRSFDLVFGCDGMHSAVRRIWFGKEAEYTHFLGLYFSVTIVDKLLIAQNTLQLFNEPGRAIMLNAYRNKTDIVFVTATDHELAYDYRDEAQQRQIIADQFAGTGWRAAELLREVQGSTSFYFDKLCQIRMPAWSKGRVVLVGDAAYCASPAAGMGGSLAIDGAAALADAMRAHPHDVARAFEAYDEKLRPFIEEVQAGAVRMGLEMLVPRTEEAIRARNEQMAGF